MKKIISSMALTLIILLPLACNRGESPKTDNDLSGDTTVATPVFKDDFEAGSPEQWKETKSGESEEKAESGETKTP